jgi:hypothetical protein
VENEDDRYGRGKNDEKLVEDAEFRHAIQELEEARPR